MFLNRASPCPPLQTDQALCDRLSIFVDGALQCIGIPKQITARYGAFLVFTLSVPPSEEGAAASFVAQAVPPARLSYALAGTLKYELPADEVRAGLGQRALLRVSVTLTEPRSS